MLLHVMTLSKVLSGNFIRYTGNKELDYLTEEGNFVKFKYCEVYEYVYTNDDDETTYYYTDEIKNFNVSCSLACESTCAECIIPTFNAYVAGGYYIECPTYDKEAEEYVDGGSIGDDPSTRYTTTKPSSPIYTKDQIKNVIAMDQNENEESYSLIEPISKKIQTIDVMKAKDLELAPLDIVQPIVEKDDKAFFFASCVAFWVAFVLIIATFILAILGVSSCCNSVNVVFPRRK